MKPQTHSSFLRRYQHGLWAEEVAAWILRIKGYQILAKRFKSPCGEIDLIARRGQTVVACEVKKRQTYEAAVSSIHPRQQHRVERSLLLYTQRLMSKEGCKKPYLMRFDVICVIPWRWPVHIKNAWPSIIK